MNGLRGIQRCRCDDNKVFGWHGTRMSDGAGGSHREGFSSLIGIKVGAVNAPYVVSRGSVAIGDMPRTDSTWSVSLLDIDPQSLPTNDKFTDVMGARVNYDDNNHTYVTYIQGRTNEQNDDEYDEGETAVAVGFTVVDLNDNTIRHQGVLPQMTRISVFLNGARWYNNQGFGNATSFGGGNAADLRLFGISRDTIVATDNFRHEDGLGTVVRYNFSTGAWAAGYAESATTAEGNFICLPAQMSEGGKAWVLAKNYDTLGMYTGVWTNTLCYNQDNEPDPGVLFQPDLPAVLTTAEVINTISLNDFIAEHVVTNWKHIAYTRAAGYDYILADMYDADGIFGRYYWDGRRGHWYSASDATNIYAFTNGDVVIANPIHVSYINAAGGERWSWTSPSGTTVFTSYEGPCISGNDNWVQVKNVSLTNFVGVTFDAGFPSKSSGADVDAANTAALDAATRGWLRKSTGVADTAVSFSREALVGGTSPTVVVHRALEHGRYSGGPAALDPFDDATAPYTQNLYASEETLLTRWVNLTSGYMESHRQMIIYPENGGMGFDCVPSCHCGCALSPKIAY